MDSLNRALKTLSSPSEWTKPECKTGPSSRFVLAESIVRLRIQLSILQSQKNNVDSCVLNILEEFGKASLNNLETALQVLVGSRCPFTISGVLRFTKLICAALNSISLEAYVLAMGHLADIVCNNLLEPEKPHYQDPRTAGELHKCFLELIHSHHFKHPSNPEVADSSLRLWGALLCFMHFYHDTGNPELDSMTIQWQMMLKLSLEERSVCNVDSSGFLGDG